MKINMLLNRINEFADVRMRNNAQQYKELKATLRQLGKVSRELEQEIHGESRKGNIKILHEKLKIITLQRKKGLDLLKDFRKTNLSII
ncbi:MAG: hypothetical protein WBN45_06060 [Arenicellales bacterium]